MSRTLIALSLALFVTACTSPDPKPADTTKPEPQPNASATPDPTPTEPSTDEGWQRGTITVGPDGMFAIHADDDSTTVCAFELPTELQQKDLAVRFRGELIPPAPNERRWCTLAKDLQVEKAQ